MKSLAERIGVRFERVDCETCRLHLRTRLIDIDGIPIAERLVSLRENTVRPRFERDFAFGAICSLRSRAWLAGAP